MNKIDFIKEWIKKAENDLKNAEYVLNMDDPPTDTVCFHSQQCAEKYLKSFLEYYNTDFGRTHNLRFLIELAK